LRKRNITLQNCAFKQTLLCFRWHFVFACRCLFGAEPPHLQQLFSLPLSGVFSRHRFVNWALN